MFSFRFCFAVDDWREEEEEEGTELEIRTIILVLDFAFRSWETFSSSFFSRVAGRFHALVSVRVEKVKIVEKFQKISVSTSL